MHGGIQRQPAQVTRRRIAEPIGGPGVRRLVNGQRGDEHDDLDENLGEIDAGQNSKGYHTAPRIRAATRAIKGRSLAPR